ncbi:flagellar biosynthesis anti-sigma factor FlgM [Edaphobacter sp.]|uniref:flagellar biosynthesis anti-sigma factor FlgM n=1 Tax=Edaphobacter sp. TaxID=1934404 RepID=UPI002DB594F6|nr:flagellar biosynthesis anti-sigma factor FlgM [Edaphobacter sp.]HEU5341409.1 flagellar biosynthesis anti-sigma factor FlgM [Edaphobacter sp.]
MSHTDGIGSLQQTTGSISATKPTQQATNAVANTRQNGESGAVRTDHAELSSTGELISKALEHSDVRMDNVQALQQAIASGTYHVSSSDVADKLIETLMN